MEHPTFPTPEHAKPDQSGELGTSKKKKNKEKLASTEVKAETSKTENRKSTRIPKSALEDLFISKAASEAKQEPAQKDEKPKEKASETSREIAAIPSPESEPLHAVEAVSNTESPEPHPSLEGEFADEATIITRVPKPQPTATAKNSDVTPKVHKPAPEALESPSKHDALVIVSEKTPNIHETDNVPLPESAEQTEEPDKELSPPRVAPPLYEPSASVRRMMVQNEQATEHTPAAWVAETAEPVTQEAINRAVHRAEKRGNSRGVLAGGIFGYWLRGRRNRSELAEAQQTIGSQKEQISDLRNEQFVAAERVTAMNRSQAELERQIRIQRRNRFQEKEPQQTEA
jgi:hypothetical protein